VLSIFCCPRRELCFECFPLRETVRVEDFFDFPDVDALCVVAEECAEAELLWVSGFLEDLELAGDAVSEKAKVQSSAAIPATLNIPFGHFARLLIARVTQQSRPPKS